MKATHHIDASVKVDISSLFQSVPITQDIRRPLIEAKGLVDELSNIARRFSAALNDLQSQDKLGNLEVQSLMSDFNGLGALVAAIMKKSSDTANAIVQNLK